MTIIYNPKRRIPKKCQISSHFSTHGSISRTLPTHQNQNCLLVTRQNDNHSPGPGPRRLVPSSHQGSELSNTIIGTFSRGDKRLWKYVPIPNGLGRGATLINNNVSTGDLICHRWSVLQRLTRVIRSSIGILALPFRSLYNYESTASPPFFEGFPF